MDALTTIFSRRSIRLYTAKPVSREMVNEILRAAMSAPSAGNERPWHFIVLTDRNILDAIPKFHPYSAMLKHAQGAILVCGDLTLEKHKGYWTLDCAQPQRMCFSRPMPRDLVRSGVVSTLPRTG